MSKLYFFRHAQASYLADNYDQLSPKGEQQSLALANYLGEKNIIFDKIFVGPLVRQQHTFEIVADKYKKQNLPIPSPIILEELREHQGTEAMRDAFPILVKQSPQVQQWVNEMTKNPALRKRNTLLAFQYFMEQWSEGNINIPNIEPWHDFRQAVKKGLATILDLTGKGKKIGVFTSGGTIASITAEALGIQQEKTVAAMNFSVRNTSFSSFLYSKEKFNLLSFNELPHLTDDMITFV